jgi:hypothetical protein
VHVAERWARTKGATTVTLRAAIHRDEAADFYQRQGYALSQRTFRKQLDTRTERPPVHALSPRIICATKLARRKLATIAPLPSRLPWRNTPVRC